MMIWFWTGVAIFAAGMLFRIGVRLKYFSDSKANERTPLRQPELRLRYRKQLLSGLALMLIGVILCFVCLYA